MGHNFSSDTTPKNEAIRSGLKFCWLESYLMVQSRLASCKAQKRARLVCCKTRGAPTTETIREVIFQSKQWIGCRPNHIVVYTRLRLVVYYGIMHYITSHSQLYSRGTKIFTYQREYVEASYFNNVVEKVFIVLNGNRKNRKRYVNLIMIQYKLSVFTSSVENFMIIKYFC